MASRRPLIVTEYDCATGETTERELTPEELAELPTQGLTAKPDTQLADALAKGVVAGLREAGVLTPLDPQAIADAITGALVKPPPFGADTKG